MRRLMVTLGATTSVITSDAGTEVASDPLVGEQCGAGPTPPESPQ